MMNREVCGDHALLQCLAEGTLTPDEAVIVKSHVVACDACRVAITEYKQVMWDLVHPVEIELPPELERSYETLMQEWKKERQSATPAKASRSWTPAWSVPAWAVPSWAAYSVSWTRNLPALGAVGSLVRRTGSSVLGRSLPRWMRRKGGERD